MKQLNDTIQRIILTAAIITLSLGILYQEQIDLFPAAQDVTSSVQAYAYQASNPLSSATLFNDTGRRLARLPTELSRKKLYADAELVQQIAAQPGATWLIGPSQSDPLATKDLETVIRTTLMAAKQKSVPVFVLYAIPRRDACAGFSSGGFTNSADYLRWIGAIVQAQRTPAAYIIEPDAIPQAVVTPCLTKEQRTERFQTLQTAVTELADSPMTLAAYLDAGHMEWTSDPRILVKPLQQSGIDKLRGISVNVAFFEPTDASVTWALKLQNYLGGNKGIVIDTSRNGNGLPPASQTGVSRWCNPKGRTVGSYPTVKTWYRNVDAFLWIKNVGESDGDCFGNPPAGTFVPKTVIDYAKNIRMND